MSKAPSTNVTQRDWLTLSEASEYLRLHRQTVRKLIRAGKLEVRAAECHPVRAGVVRRPQS